MIKINIDGKQIGVESGSTVLDAARQNGIYIPSLCYHHDLTPYGGCRLCIVEIDGMRDLPTSCTTHAENGMVVRTNTGYLRNLRRKVFELILSEHDKSCTSCAKNLRCELQTIAAYLGVEKLTLPFIEKKFTVNKDEPFYDRDYNLCILCGRCVRVCDEIRKNAVVDFTFRGIKSVPGTAFNKKLKDSNCEFCGSCVDICPTGALLEKDFGESLFPDRTVTTICPYCGVGCLIKLEIKNEKIARVVPDIDGPANEGQLCVKGRFGIKEFVHHKDRLKKPLARQPDGSFKEISWEEALNLVADKFKEIKNKYGPDAIAGLASAKCTNEENYIFQKFMRAVVGTNNVDHCARLCHAPSVAGLAQTLGSGAMTNSIGDIEKADCFIVIGSNTTEAHPVIALKIKKAVMNNSAKLIVIDPREIPLCEIAELHLAQAPGSDVAVLNCLANEIYANSLHDAEFISKRTEGFEDYVKSIAPYKSEYAEKISGVSAEKLKKAAQLYGSAERGCIIYSMGITQHTNGTDNVIAISNLALLTGNLGKEGTGVNPLRGQNNVQGACDMACLPNVLPGYQKIDDPAVRSKFESAWQVILPSSAGLTVTEIIQRAHSGEIKALIVMGENPMVSDPDINHVKKALMRMELLVVQDIFLSETALLADVVLPSCSFAEKDGTFTNTERRVQLLRKAINPVGDSKSDWEIICGLSNKMGYAMRYDSAREIMDEISSLTPIYGGIVHKKLDGPGVQWPCPSENHTGTKILHTEKFSRGLGKFIPVGHTPPSETADGEYPLILTTGRVLYHYHTGTMSRKVNGLNDIFPECVAEINHIDARNHSIRDGEKIRVVSRRGSITARAYVTDKILKGVVFLPFHFAEAAANILTNSAIDPKAKTPELKVCAVKIEKID